LAACAAPAPVDDDDGVDPTPDPDEEVEVVPEATIGPAGGVVGLAGGASLVVPAGALQKDALFTIVEVDPEDPGYPLDVHGGLGAVGPAFVVTPHLATLGPPFEIYVPTDDLPSMGAPGRVVLLLSSDGRVDGFDDAHDDRVHPLRPPARIADDVSTFELVALGPGVHQPMVHLLDPDDDEGRDELALPADLETRTCSEALADSPEVTDIPEDIDDEVTLATTLRADFEANLATLTSEDHQQEVLDALQRFTSRSCLAAFRARSFFDERMDLPQPPGEPAFPITIAWHYGSLDANGSANANGLTMYFNPTDELLWLGSIPQSSWHPGWNTSPAAWEPSHVGKMEGTVAHEMFHYLDDWANYDKGDISSSVLLGEDLPRGQTWIEGAASAASDLAFDEAPMSASKQVYRIWAEPAFEQPYRGQVYWRFLDWHADGYDASDSVTTRALQAERERSWRWLPNDPLRGEEIDAAIDAAYSDVEGYDRLASLPDLGLQYLARYDIESGAEDDAGGTDAMEIALPEQESFQLWATGGHSLISGETFGTDPALPDNPGLEYRHNETLPYTEVLSLGPHAVLARLVPGGAVVSLAAVDAAGDPTEEVGWRLAAAAADSVDAQGDSLPEGEHAVVADDALGSTHWLAVANRSDEAVEVTLTLSEAAPRLFALGRGGDGELHGFEFDPDGSTTLSPLTFASDAQMSLTGRGRSIAAGGDLGPLALVTASEGYLARFVLSAGAEEQVMPPLSFDDWGTAPRGLAVTPGGDHALVGLTDAVALIDVDSWAVVGAVAYDALGLTSDERPWDVAMHPDGSSAYVSLWGFPDPGDRLLVLNWQDMLAEAAAGDFDGWFSAAVVSHEVTIGGGNPQNLALSPDGATLAVTLTESHGVALIDAAGGDTLIDVTPDEPSTYALRAPDFFEDSQGPTALLWEPDSAAVYVGYTSGIGRLDFHGVVRRCPIAEGHCDQEVGVQHDVRSLARTGPVGAGVVWVLDGVGLVTPLTEDLFIPELGVNAGTDPWGVYDGTGGCVYPGGGGEWIAEPCPWVADIGQSGSELVTVEGL
jgi:hypothetical protein